MQKNASEKNEKKLNSTKTELLIGGSFKYKYLQSLPTPEQAELRRIRDIVIATVPEATETTS